MGISKRLILPLLVLLIIFEVGVIGYELIEGWGFLDALYMTTISLATVGYGEVHPLSSIGRVFTIGLLFSGVGILLYVVGSVVAFLVEGELGGDADGFGDAPANRSFFSGPDAISEGDYLKIRRNCNSGWLTVGE